MSRTIVVYGRSFDELTQAAIAYVSQYPELAARGRWYVSDEPGGWLRASAEVLGGQPLYLGEVWEPAAASEKYWAHRAYLAIGELPWYDHKVRVRSRTGLLGLLGAIFEDEVRVRWSWPPEQCARAVRAKAWP